MREQRFPGRGPDGAAVSLIEIDSHDTMPLELPVPGRQLVAMIACDSLLLSDSELRCFVQRALNLGTIWATCWGLDCKRVHDAFDWEAASRSIDQERDIWVMTTYHEGEQLETALDFYLRHSYPPEEYRSSPSSHVVLCLESQEYFNTLAMYLHDPELLAFRVAEIIASEDHV